MSVGESTLPVLVPGPTVDEAPWEELPEIGQGAAHKVLWRSGDSIAGLMRLADGGWIDSHAHRRAHHHLWVVDGAIDVLGTTLGPGSYGHVPAGVTHGMVSSGGPATFFYLYLQPS
jgi:hypothetical protein